MKKNFKKPGRFYKNLRLQTKFTITHLVIATIPMIVLGIFFHTKLYDMIVSDTIRTEQSASAHTVPLIEDSISRILDVHDKVTNQEFYRLAVSPGRTTSLNELGASNSAQKFQTKVDELVSDNLVTDIKFYVDIPRTESFFTDNAAADTVLPINNAWGTYWYGIFNGDPTLDSLFCPSFYLGSYEIKHNGDMAYITKSSVMYNGERTPCYLAVYFSQSTLDALLKDNLSTNSNVAYLINDRDSMIASSSVALSGTYHFSYDEVKESFMSSNNFILKNVLGEDVYAGFYSIRNTDWYMVVAMPSQPMIEKSAKVVGGFILVYILCIIIAFLIATVLSSSITKRLSTVIRQMARARSGPPVALPAPDTQDEIGDLINTYNYMTLVINKLMDNQARAAEDLRIAEFNSLQAQINPHFLYNTMDMINWLSQQGRSQDVTRAIQKLSRFYKLTLSRKQSLSTIEDEIEHVSIYVELQNMRFHDTIDFLIDMPDNLLEYSIPKLTFQPVIENCILHGILEKESKQGTIVLTGWLEGETIVILISDDGVGIQEETLNAILSEDAVPSGSSGTNIAVYNTHRRLQLMYGPEYGLSYSSTPGQGTDVEIRIPARLPSDMPAGAVTPTAYTTGTPLEDSHFVQALHLLSRPDINIYEIAKECGYEDAQEFSKAFKDMFGYSPEEYRAQVL